MLSHPDLFTFTTLTNSINKLPNAPEDLGRWFKWHAQGITTLTATIEERDGVIGLVQSQPRGAAPQSVRRDTRRAKAIPVPHYPLYDSVLATEVQSVRAFGSDSEMETVAGAIEDKQIAMRRDMETTHEYQRAGALNGLLLDADGTVIADWYDFFKKPKTTHVIDLTNPNTDVRSEVVKAVQKGERALGNLRPRRWKWIQGSDFHLNCIGHASVKAAYDRWNDGAALREDLREAGFMLASNVEVISYHRGYIVTPNGEVRFIAPDESILVPDLDGLLQVRYAPADTVEAANTIGLPLYLSAEPMPFGRGVALCAESNSIHYCTRIESIVHIRS